MRNSTLGALLGRLSLFACVLFAGTAGAHAETLGVDERATADPLSLSIDWFEGFTGHTDTGAGLAHSSARALPGLNFATGARVALALGFVLYTAASGDLDSGVAGVVLANTPAVLPEGAQKALDELGANIKRVLALEEQIAVGVDAGKGVADLKQEVAVISKKNAELVDEAKKGFDARLDEMEKAYQKNGFPGSEAQKSAGQLFVESEEYTGASNKAQIEKGVIVTRESLRAASAFAKALTLSSNATPPMYSGEVVRQQDVRRAMRDLIPGGRSAQNLVKYVRVTVRPILAEMVAAGGTKPEAAMTVADAEAAMRKIAHYIPVNEESLIDSEGIRSTIDAEMEYGIELKEDDQILNGNGVGQNLSGLIVNATAYVPATYGSTVTAATRIDHVRGMLAQLAVALHVPDGIVLNPLDWFKIETTKDADNAYIFARVQDAAGARMWGLPVVETTQLTADTCLVGNFRLGAQLYDGQVLGQSGEPQYGIVLKTGWINDQFIKNQLSIIAEERIALAVKRPGAFVTGDLTPA